MFLQTVLFDLGSVRGQLRLSTRTTSSTVIKTFSHRRGIPLESIL
jgi:hypothetical protein